MKPIRCALALLIALSSVAPGSAVVRIAPVKVSPSIIGVGSGGALGSAQHSHGLSTHGLDTSGALQPVLPSLSKPAGTHMESQVVGAAIAADGAVAQMTTPAPSLGTQKNAADTGPRGSIPAKKEKAENLPFLKEISSAKLPAILWTNGRDRRGEAMTAVSAAASFFRRSPNLNAVAPSYVKRPREGIAAPEDRVRIPAQVLRRRLLDSLQYRYITASSLAWYTFPRFIERWRGLMRSRSDAKGKTRAVHDYRGFFIAHRVLGSTGNYAPMGFRVAANRIVTQDAWKIFDRYFTPDKPAKESFSRFIDRAKRYNPNRRSTQFRKLIFHALREASVLSVSELPAFFDSQATDKDAAILALYQQTEQDLVLETFERLVNETLREINIGHPAGRRAVGALLLGSFANHAAGPGSDLDLQVVTEDGSAHPIPLFMERLKQKWKETGFDNPIGGFQYGLPLSKRLVMRVHIEPYLLFSPYPEVLEAMRLTPAEELAGPASVQTFRSAIFQFFYTQLLKGVLAGYEAYYFVRKHIRL